MSKTLASCFIRGSRHFETIKALGLRPRAFICFSVSGTPDETLALVFDILPQISSFRKCLETSSLRARNETPSWLQLQTVNSLGYSELREPIKIQSNPAISNSVNSKSPLFRRRIEFPWIYPYVFSHLLSAISNSIISNSLLFRTHRSFPTP